MNKKNIQDDFRELDKIIDKLEGQKVDLEESMKLFEKGSDLIKECHKQLKEAKNRFQEVRSDLEKELED